MNTTTKVSSQVQALLDTRVAACRDKDIDLLMSLYDPDIVYFDVVAPLRFTGADAVRRNFLRWFGEHEGPIGLETHALAVTAGDGAAFAHMLHRDTGAPGQGAQAHRKPGRGYGQPCAAPAPPTSG